VHCAIPEVLIGGKAEQTTYIGKNLFNKDNETAILMCQNSSGIIATSKITTAICIPCDPNTTYSAQKILSSRFAVYATTEYPVIGIPISLIGSTGGTTITFTTPDNAAYILIFVHNANYDTDITVQSVLESIQIELGPVVTSYEPYTGGVSAPSPLYPIEPVFSDQTKILSRGRNMFDFVNLAGGEGYTNTLNGVTVTIENGYAVFKGEHTNDGWSNVLNIQGLQKDKYILPAGTYSAPHNNGTNNSTRISLTIMLNKRGSYDGLGNRFKTFTLDEYAWVYGFYVAFYGPQTVDYRLPLVLVEGSETPTEYIPYFDGGEVEVPKLLSFPNKPEKDLFNPQTGELIQNLIEITLTGEETFLRNADYEDYHSFYL
jgi:hypothetical protein